MLLAIISPPSALGQTGQTQQAPQAIELADLPDPPAPIQAWIESGRVTFEQGEREVSIQPVGGPRITAETRYRIVYSYNSRSRWKVEKGTREIVITVRFARIEWKPVHTIWFRNPPAAADFWTNKLVLHEFDHVRISSDPRLAVRFKQLLNDRNILKRTLSDDDVVNRDFVDQLVDRHVAEVFSEISDLIAIRYKELDRVTNHGLDLVPSDSPLNEWLRPDNEGSE